MPPTNDPTSPSSNGNGNGAGSGASANATSLPADAPRSTSGAQGWLANLRGRLGLGPQQTLRETLEEAVRSETAADDTFSAAERDMLLRLLRFGGLRVDDVMVPRADIVAIEDTASLGELMALFEEAGVSRIPIYHETLDDPRGMVHVKDLLSFLAAGHGGVPGDSPGSPAKSGSGNASAGKSGFSQATLASPIACVDMMRQVLHVPASMPAINLLIRMQATRNHIALVVDEYGGTDGLVTIEDLVEQVVGDIEDEHDIDEDANIHEDQRHGLIAQARTPITELEDYLGTKLLKTDDEGDIDTLGGLVVAMVGRVPARGELVPHDSGYEFEVIDADPRRVNRIKIHRPRQLGKDAAESGAPAGKTGIGEKDASGLTATDAPPTEATAAPIPSDTESARPRRVAG